MLRFGTPRISTGVPQTEPVAEFDSQLWASMVECVTVGVDRGANGGVSGWDGSERVGIWGIKKIFENPEKVKKFNIGYAIL